MNNFDYSICSKSPSAVWADPKIFTNRIDASYYSATYLQLDDKFKNQKNHSQKSLGSLLVDPRRILYMKTETFEKSEGTDGKIPFISGVDIDENIPVIKWEQPKYVENWMADQYPKGLLFPKALLIKVKGPNQLAAYIENPPNKALISGTCVLCGVKDVDPFYLVAYLTSMYAQVWRTRLRQNITVEFTPYEELAEIPIVLPKNSLQKAIGDKVRKAIRLNEIAKDILLKVNRKISKLYLEEELPVSKNLSWICSDYLSDIRLDAWFHRQFFLDIEQKLKERNDLFHVKDICEIVTDNANLKTWDNDSFYYFDIGSIDNESLQATPEKIKCKNAPSRAKYLVQTGDLLIATLGIEQKSITVVPDQYKKAVCSSGFSVLRSEDIDIIYYVQACFCNEVATQQLLRWISGSILPSINRNVPHNILIPNPGIDTIKEIGAFAYKAHKYRILSASKIKQAKNDVQSIIDGTLDTDKLLSKSKEIERWLKDNPSSTISGRNL